MGSRLLLLALAAAAAAFHLWSAGVAPFTALIQRPVHLALMGAIGLLMVKGLGEDAGPVSGAVAPDAPARDGAEPDGAEPDGAAARTHRVRAAVSWLLVLAMVGAATGARRAHRPRRGTWYGAPPPSWWCSS